MQSKKAKEFTAKINKANVNVQKNYVGRKAVRIKDATRGKKTGSLRKGNLSFPGDRSGAYQATKSDIEARKGFKGAKTQTGAGKTKTIPGLKADEKNPYVKRSVRKTRVDKLGGDIYDAPKFSQKEFDKSFKAVGRNLPGGAKVPLIPDPFGKGDTPGETRVKGLERKAFKKTQPSDVKLPKSFTDFEKNLQDYKDKDKATMRTGKSSSKVKVSGANNLTRQDVGMAPPDKPVSYTHLTLPTKRIV